MDVFRNPDEVIKEVEDNEERREVDQDVTQELDESPEDEDKGPEDPKDG
ncbi:MAG TPA: hypothetical protein VEW45_03980 [Candidatus Dormibacteraeota bacterium]|nr:hypothetical protein [Candidatus Dormibacteraeota bacterium]